MKQDAAERVYSGIPASEGLVHGRIFLIRAVSATERSVGAAEEEAVAMRAAVNTARGQFEALMAGEDPLAGEIMEFQLALLEDDNLLNPVFDAIRGGVPAHRAWGDHLDQEIDVYRAGDEEYLAARADDLLDLKTRVMEALYAEHDHDGPDTVGCILVADDLTPSRFLEIDWTAVAGAATVGGSRTSHVSILARARGVPLIVGLGASLTEIEDGQAAILDAERGHLVLAPTAISMAELSTRLGDRTAMQEHANQALPLPGATATGERVRVLINVDDPGLLDTVNAAHCDGIGLTRTEFLFHRGYLPGEDEQFNVYRRIIEWAAGRPVTIRTLDAGGDKPIPGVTQEGEANPFLGVRGLRLSLRNLEVFRVQLRALARASAFGQVKVMVPMVSVPSEMDEVRGLVRAVVGELASDGVPHAMPELGMMVEVPAAALMAESFAADFYSIGSNDLIQYTMAVARDNPALAHLTHSLNPAVLSLIQSTVDAGRARDVEVSLCGDLASDPASVSVLLSTGLRTLSVSPARIGLVKTAIAEYSIGSGPS